MHHKHAIPVLSILFWLPLSVGLGGDALGIVCAKAVAILADGGHRGAFREFKRLAESGPGEAMIIANENPQFV